MADVTHGDGILLGITHPTILGTTRGMIPGTTAIVGIHLGTIMVGMIHGMDMDGEDTIAHGTTDLGTIMADGMAVEVIRTIVATILLVLVITAT